MVFSSERPSSFLAVIVPPEGPVIFLTRVGPGVKAHGALVPPMPGRAASLKFTKMLAHPLGVAAHQGTLINHRATGFAIATGHPADDLRGPYIFIFPNGQEVLRERAQHPMIRECHEAGWDMECITGFQGWINHPAWGGRQA